MYLAAIYEHHVKQPDGPALPAKLRSIYILPPNQFPEVDAFVQTSAAHYQLDLDSSSKPMKSAFEEYLEEHKEVKAIFVGTRRTDPHGGSLKHFDPTDRGWPSFMRIHPVIDWHYREIWAVSSMLFLGVVPANRRNAQFIRHLQIPYCSLYDKGYTSLGGTNDTLPNPKLAQNSKDFKPAYELIDDEEERLGRDHA